MSAQQKRKTPAERADEFAATQVRLKQEAAARRAAPRRAPQAVGSSRTSPGRQRSGY